jgi:hypothetical protein
VTATRDRSRQLSRVDRLRKNEQQYRDAQRQLREIHRQGRAPATIVVRRSLITRRGAGGPSPAAQLITPKGIGLSLYLTVLFDAQSRRPAGARIRNARPLLTTGNDVGWTDLLPAVTTGADPDVDMLRQVHRALQALERVRLVELRRRGRPGRYEQFKVLDESGGGLRGRTAYVIPNRVTSATGELLVLPAGFFMNGWAHVLLPAEIFVYLALLNLRTAYDSDSVFIADSVKDQVYSMSRDVYEHHQALTAYGLIRRHVGAGGRSDGTPLRQFEPGMPPMPHHFELADNGFSRDALSVVTGALSRGW